MLLLSLAPIALGAQTPARTRATNEHAWFQAFHEQRLTDRWAFHGEVQLRRADVGLRSPQQTLLRSGMLYDVTPGLRSGGGYAYAWTSVYGEAPAATPSPEHRVWQQLQVASRTGPVAWAHRFRAEQRWLGQTVRDGDDVEVASWRFRQRARAMTRATIDAPTLGIPVRRAYLTAHGELFAQVGATPDGQVFDQSRVAMHAGWRLTPAARLEAGYMQQLIQRGGSRLTENNHTLVVSLFTTGR